MNLVYATVDDLKQYVDDVPKRAELLLKLASRMVYQATKTAWYRVDSNGMPTNEVVREAFREATCLQVLEWQLAGLDPLAGVVGQSAGVKASSIDGARVEYSETSEEAMQRALTRLCGSAYATLNVLGLCGRVWAY